MTGDQWCERCDRVRDEHAEPCRHAAAPPSRRSALARERHVPARRRLLTGRRTVSLAAWVAALALPAATAVALWSTGGAGDGASKSLTATNLQVAAGAVSADLYPGGTGTVSFAVTNPNGYAVTVNAGSAASISSITGAAGACTSSNFTLGAGVVAPVTIAAGATSTVVMTGALTMKTTAGDGCQGATLAVSATLTGTQS